MYTLEMSALHRHVDIMHIRHEDIMQTHIRNINIGNVTYIRHVNIRYVDTRHILAIKNFKLLRTFHNQAIEHF